MTLRGPFATFGAMPQLTEGLKELLFALSVPGLYCLLVLGGRRLKRKHGVRLGVLYHLLAACLAVYASSRRSRGRARRDIADRSARPLSLRVVSPKTPRRNRAEIPDGTDSCRHSAHRDLFCSRCW